MTRKETAFSSQGMGSQRWGRAASLAAAASVVVAVLWAAGLPPTAWLGWATKLLDRDVTLATSGNGSGGTQASDSSGPSSVPLQLAEPFVGTDSSVSQAPVPLYLLSVELGRNATEGTARIGTSVDNPQTYAAGALLANGSRLAEIHSDHVVLERDNRSARLLLHDRGASTKSPATTDDLLAVGGGDGKASSAPAPTHEPLTEYLRPNPVFDGEQLRGYEVYPGANRSLFAQLGLQPGDIIVAIDGVPVTDAEQTLQMLRELHAGAALTVGIERRQQRQRLTLDGGAIRAGRERVQQLSSSPPGG